jgi:TolB protein
VARSRRASPFVSAEGTSPKQQYTLIVADADGENQQKIASSTEPIMSPAWSPDGQSLAYVSFESKASAIYIQTLKLASAAESRRGAGINGAPAWSPDGSTLALTLSRKDGDVDIYTLKLGEPDAHAHDVRPRHRYRAGMVR